MNFEGYLAIGKMMTIQFINNDKFIVAKPPSKDIRIIFH
ncbi:hypothetical protein BH18THE1_BH18THE1_19900 [soil metagenome]